MGGVQSSKRTGGDRKAGKVDTSLNEKLNSIEWGEYRLGDLFEKIKVRKLAYKTSELPSRADEKFNLPALTAGILNQGLNNYVPREEATVLKRVISISANGANTGATFYQKHDFTVLQDAYAIKFKEVLNCSDRHNLFMASMISKTIYGQFEWTNKARWEKVKDKNIKLPTKNGKIDFEFMEDFIAELEAQHIAELEAYLSITGLKDYHLTTKEKEALEKLNSVEWGSFNLEKLFGKSTRGKRLKGDDRIKGGLPFVTAGETNEGISAFIGNKVQVFSKNTTTIDMFGSAKYRNYDYGGDDHIAVVHTEDLPCEAAIFVTTAIHKSSCNGQFHYGRNFYAKDADDLNIMLPLLGVDPDYGFMKTLISAIQKLVIKDVVLYSENKINATKEVVEKK